VIACRRLFLLAVLTAALLPHIPARAEMFGTEYQTCEEFPGDPAVMACLNARIKAWEQKLAAALRDLAKRIDKGQHAPLAEAQRAWARFRDVNCRFYEARDGSISKLHVLECRRAMTEARAQEIEKARRED
jgi:uncharacterized protein YecT (DUF1311 family)